MIQEENRTKLNPEEVERSRRVVLDYIGGETLKHENTKTQEHLGRKEINLTSRQVSEAGENMEEQEQKNTLQLRSGQVKTRKHENTRTQEQEGDLEKDSDKDFKSAFVPAGSELRRGGLPLARLFRKTEQGESVGPQKPVARKKAPAGNKNYFYKDKIGKYRIIFLTIVLALLIILFAILISETVNL